MKGGKERRKNAKEGKGGEANGSKGELQGGSYPSPIAIFPLEHDGTIAWTPIAMPRPLGATSRRKGPIIARLEVNW
jgi:hypothetical protein